MRPWQFSKPKTPGFGLARGYYLSVLSSRAVLPSIIELVNPEGAGGAISGFGAPLVADKEKSRLARPLERGAYAISTKDRKTVLRVMVISKEEAGFDPEAYLRSPLAVGLDPEVVVRMRATWTLTQFLFESHDPMVYPAVDFLQDLVVRLGVLSDGVIADPISRRYLLPGEVRVSPRADPRIDAREHVAVQTRQRPDGLSAYTLGMQKFDRNEFELPGIQVQDFSLAANFLLALCQTVLVGERVEAGDTVGPASMPFQVAVGGFDRAVWEGIEVFELLPPTTRTSSEVLRDWRP